MELKKWEFLISQNDWEYAGSVIITAKKVEVVNKTTILADGIRLEFDEEIQLYDE